MTVLKYEGNLRAALFKIFLVTIQPFRYTQNKHLRLFFPFASLDK